MANKDFYNKHLKLYCTLCTITYGECSSLRNTNAH